MRLPVHIAGSPGTLVITRSTANQEDSSCFGVHSALSPPDSRLATKCRCDAQSIELGRGHVSAFCSLTVSGRRPGEILESRFLRFS